MVKTARQDCRTDTTTFSDALRCPAPPPLPRAPQAPRPAHEQLNPRAPRGELERAVQRAAFGAGPESSTTSGRVGPNAPGTPDSGGSYLSPPWSCAQGCSVQRRVPPGRGRGPRARPCRGQSGAQGSEGPPRDPGRARWTAA
eukprot:11850409-Alexandrium_andersonii.AAC.1